MTDDLSGALPVYKDPNRPVDERVDDLVSRMTLEEKVSQMVHPAAAIERLDIPAYNWWNECLHGVARAGIATVFPQAIGMAATWDPALIYRMAVATSDEARAKHHEAVRQGIRDIYTGLTFWSPNINIFRDPRWGRGQETYGEDPYLTSRLAVAFVRGLQGDDPRYLKVVATSKHYAVHSGPERLRHQFDARVTQRDLRETYLPAFEATVREAKVEAVMGAYNRTNGEPCCASPTLLQKILREEWGFEGHVVSDCWAIRDIYRDHKVVDTPEAAAALAVRNGCDLNCGDTFPALVRAVEQGLITEQEIDCAVKRLFRARFRLGMFDPPEMVPYAKIPYSVNDCEEHRQLAREVALESMVLLKNAGALPIAEGVRKIAVIGPNADDVEVLLGNYNGTPSRAVTPLEGIRARAPSGVDVTYAKGCGITERSTEGFAEAVEVARSADLVIACVGLSQAVEGEEGRNRADDRPGLDLPGVQEDLLKAVHETGTPLVVVLINGSPVAVNWAEQHAVAILEAWYPGEEGGTAIAEVLFGDYNPGGRLPVTFFKSHDQLPDFTDYNMAGHTYRFSLEEPLYPFGYGLSYTRFSYSSLTITPDEIQAGQRVQVRATVKNTGECAGDEVVQLYLSDVESTYPVPLRSLVGLRRVHLKPQESREVVFEITPQQMAAYDDDGRRIVEPGAFAVSVGGGQPLETGAAAYLTDTFVVRGEALRLE